MGRDLTRRRFVGLAVGGAFAATSCGGPTAPDGSKLPPVSQAKGTANATALENLALITAFARREHSDAYLYWIGGRGNASTGRADAANFWTYHFALPGASSGDNWVITSSGTIEYQPSVPLTSSFIQIGPIADSLRVDSDQVVQIARGAGFEPCANGSTTITVNYYDRKDQLFAGFPMCSMAFDPRPGSAAGGGYIWVDARSGAIDAIVSPCT